MTTRPKFTRRASKIRPVPIGQLTVPPAFITQRPFIPSHGKALANDLDLNKLGYPIVNHRDGKFWLVDGQHRIYALKENGLGGETDMLDCEVYEGLSDEEMAATFLGRDARKAIAPFVKFHIACTAGHIPENAVLRVVLAHGLKVKRAREENCISAVGALLKIYATSPGKDVAVGWVCRVAKNAFNGDPAGFDAFVLEALSLVYNRYNGRLNEKDLIGRLSQQQHGVRGIMRRAEALKERTGSCKTQCLSSVIVDIYNKAITSRQHRLAPWWKETAAA